MVTGAARELKVGDPRELSTHVGPVIDAEAKDRSSTAGSPAWSAPARVRFRCGRATALAAAGTYVGPAIIELDRARDLKEEVFGPVLHVVRWRADELDALLDDIAGNGTALTLGIHSRIDSTVDAHRRAACERQRLRQPQHDRRRGRHPAVRRHRPVGHRAEGRRPELSAPLRAEQVVTVNTAAAGGNASLLAQEEL